MAKGKYSEWITDDGLLQLRGWARDGLTDEQIAKKVGIRRETLYDWIKRFPNISNALKKGRGPVDEEVEDALHRSTIGYIVTLKKPMKLRDENGAEHVEYVQEEIYVAPSVTAQIFYLRNRKKDRWKNNPEETTGYKEELLKNASELLGGIKSVIE